MGQVQIALDRSDLQEQKYRVKVLDDQDKVILEATELLDKATASAVAKALVNVGGHANVVTNLVTGGTSAWIMDGVRFRLTEVNETEFLLKGETNKEYEQFVIVKSILVKVEKPTWWPVTEDPGHGNKTPTKGLAGSSY